MSYDPFDALVRGVPTGYGGVLCLGAVSPGLVRYLSDNVGAQVHVCDFDEQRLQLLQSEMQENSAVQYHNALPLFEAGDLPEIGYHCSEPTHSSLALPSGITEILPGLIFEPVEVEGLAFTDLFEEGNFSTSEANLLILATNGYEASWLAKESAVAALFSTVLIRSPRSNCFETVDTQVLVDDLAQSGLPAISLPMGRPPYESIAIHQAHDWQGRGEEITNLKAALEAADTDAAALGQRISSLEAELSSTSTTLKASDEAKDSAEAECKALRSSLLAVEEEVSSKSASLSNVEGERVMLKERVSSLEADLSSTLEQAKAHEKEATSLTEKLQNVEQEKREQTESASLAQKMLVKLQGDLEALRDKYEQKVISERDMMNLISELRKKLTAASQYYFRLQQAHPELLTPGRSDNEY